MKICIVDKENNCGFYKIDGRNLEKFLSSAERVNGKLQSAWTYTNFPSNGCAQGVKEIITNYRRV